MKVALSVYSRIAGCAMSLAATTELPPLEWQLERYSDPLHRAGVVAAASGTSEADGSDIITAIVRCWSATGEVDVRFALDRDRTFSADDVRWQFDHGPTRTARWRMSPQGNAMVVPESSKDEIVRGMRDAKELTLVLLSDGEHRYRISLFGSSRAIGEIQKLCAP